MKCRKCNFDYPDYEIHGGLCYACNKVQAIRLICNATGCEKWHDVIVQAKRMEEIECKINIAKGLSNE